MVVRSSAVSLPPFRLDLSALVVRLPGVGFKLSSSQLFWLAVMAVTFWFGSKDGPELEKRRKARLKPESLCDARALKKLQVWRFSLYSLLVFGGFVALALGCRTPDFQAAGLMRQ